MYTCIFVVERYESYLFQKYFYEKPGHGQLIELKSFELVATDNDTRQYGAVCLHGLFTVTATESGTIEQLFPTLDAVSLKQFEEKREYVKVDVTELIHTCKEIEPHILVPLFVAYS